MHAHFKDLLSSNGKAPRSIINLEVVKEFMELNWITGEFSSEELSIVINRLKNNKTPGIDGILAEVLKNVALRNALLEMFNMCYNTKTVPDEWHQSILVPIFKKGDPTKCGNYRGIALMSICAKLYNLLLLERLRVLDPKLRHNQNGSRVLRSTAQQVLALRRIIEEVSSVKDKKLLMVFIDFSKAYDSIDWNYIESILLSYSVPAEIVNAIMSVYYGAQASVKVDGVIADPIDLGVGVLQGDTLAPFLFVIVLDWILRNAIPDENLGLNVSGRCEGDGIRKSSRNYPSRISHLTDLCYVDDIALLADNACNANSMLASLSVWALKVGLKINISKTEYVLVGFSKDESVNINVDGFILKEVPDFKYLGSWIMSSEADFIARKDKAWGAMSKLDNIWRSNEFSKQMKFMFFQSLIESILFYNATTWTISASLLVKIIGTYNKMLRKALNVLQCQTNKNGVVSYLSNAQMFDGTDYVCPSVRLRKMRLTFAGHCFRRRNFSEDTTVSYQSISDLIFWKLPTSGKNKYYDKLLFDVSDEPGINSISKLQTFMSDKESWYQYANKEYSDCRKKEKKREKIFLKASQLPGYRLRSM